MVRTKIISMGRRISFMFSSIAAARKLQFMGLLRRHDN